MAKTITITDEEYEKIKSQIQEQPIGLAIKNRWTGAIIFQSTKTTYMEAVKEALERNSNLRNSNLRNSDLSNSNLSDSNLSGSNLSGSDLRDSNLSGSEMRNVKFYGKGGTTKIKKSQINDLFKALGIIVED